MGNQNSTRRSSSFNLETSEEKLCWICYDNNEFEDSRNWVSPCKCCGTSKWVHQACLQLWIDEQLKRNANIKAQCFQCKTEYKIVYNEVNFLVQILNSIDEIQNLLCSILVRAFVASYYCYWLANRFGEPFLVQVMGEQKALKMMKETNPHTLILMLPAISVCVILSEIINFEDIILFLVQRYTSKFPWLRTIMPSFLYEPIISTTSSVLFNPVINPTTILCTSLLLPTTATTIGHFLFSSSYSKFQKKLLGGLVFFAFKKVLNIYQRQCNAKKEMSKRVVNYQDSDNEESH